MKRNSLYLLSACMALGLTAWCAAQETTLRFIKPGEPPQLANEAAVPLRLVEKQAKATSFESRSSSCQMRTERLADGDYSVLEMTGGGRCGEVGEPQFPCYGDFVEIPDDVTVKLVIDDVDWIELDGKFNIAPRQQSPTDKAGAPNPPFAKNQMTYQKDEFLPAQPVCLVEKMRVRHKAFVYVNYLPIAYNPRRSVVKVARQVKWHLEYDPQQGKPFQSKARTDSLGTKEFAPFFDRVLNGKPVVTELQSTLTDGVSTTNGADYLIITHDNFYANILPFAQWKHAKGYRTRVVKTSEISGMLTCTNLTEYISNAYNNWNPAPTFVLLVGDAEYIPAWYKTTHSFYGSNAKAGTDLYYAAIDGSDYFPDLFLGRLPCASTAQCDLMVSKILKVEKTPDLTESLYRTLLTSGEYTDSGGGYEERIFIETAEAVRDFHIATGYTVPTSYCTDTTATPRHYNLNNSLLHVNGALYGGVQNYVGTSAGTAAISNAINAGVWLVQHRDHGSQTGGWATPPWSPTSASRLINANKLPVVMSINCETAWFDGGSDSLAEAFLKNTQGGAYAVIGATRVSYSWYNDWFTHGLYECMYTNYFETLSGLSYYKPGLTYGNNYVGHGTHLGQLLNFAKILMYQKEGSSSTTQIQFDILTLLGDPEQSPRNAVPKTFTVSHPSQLNALFPASFSITVTAADAPVSGALVALVLDPDEYHTAYTDESGLASFSFTPLMPLGGTNGLMAVTVSEQNFIPYIGSMTISPKGFVIGLPVSTREGDGTLYGQGLLRVIPTPTTNVTVSLISDDTSEILVPPTVTILANQSSVAFNVTVVEDGELDGSQTATIIASAPEFSSGSGTIRVDDNETAILNVVLPSTTDEDAGTVTGQITVSAPVDANVTVGLDSSDLTELTLPTTVIVPAGQTNAAFTATIINDTQIDGPQTVWVTAHVQNWVDGSNSFMVLDNEPTNLVVTLPTLMREGQGVLTNAGVVRIFGTWPTPLTVSLVSSDVTDLTVPSSIVIPAGQTSVAFNIAAVDDTEQDGPQTVVVTAGAPGFAAGSAGTTVADNDIHHFSWSAIPSPQSAGTPFSVTVAALDITDIVISNYTGTSSFSGIGANGSATLFPTGSGAFSNGRWTGSLTVSSLDTNMRLVANDGWGHSGTSMPFTVIIGPLHHFAWAPVAPTQRVDTSFAASVAAKDAANNTVSNFVGVAALKAYVSDTQRDVLYGADSWNYPMSTYYHDARTQVIYLSSELGGPALLSGLSLYVNSKPGQTMNVWTIRMKSTPLMVYGAKKWETNDWTVVVQTNMTVSTTGWINFPFSTPFAYNGTNNLLVDFSFNNVGYTSDGYCRCTSVATNRSLYFRTDSGYGDPLAWTGTTTPGMLTNLVPNLRLTVGTPVVITPTNTGNFVGGVWNGVVTGLEPASNMFVRADDGNGHSGASGMFTVNAIADMRVDLSDSQSTGTVGAPLALWVNVHNYGPNRAFDVRIVDTLPASVSFVSAEVSQGTISNADGTVAWNVGVMSDFYAWAKILVVPTLGGALTNAVTLTANVTDPDLSNNTDSKVTTVTGCGILAVTPGMDLSARGFVGGPFVPPSQTYTLTNSGTDTLAWQAFTRTGWVIPSPVGGTLAPRACTAVTVTIDAARLPAGAYADTLILTNLTTGIGSTNRNIDLTVMRGGSLQTIFASDNGYAGNMFDIVPNRNLGINGFDVNVSPSGQVTTVAVCYRRGSSFGHENSSTGWSLLGSRVVTAAGQDNPTFVDLSGNGMEFLRGQTYGFYVYVNYGSGATMQYTKGSGTYGNSALALISNCGKGDPPFTGETYPSRIWNGSIYYDTGLVDALGISPAEGLLSQGPECGSFIPSNKVYTLSNRGESNVIWTAACASNWVSVVPGGGITSPEISNNVTVTLSAAANALAAGTYSATVAFSNTSSGAVKTREVVLNVWNKNLTVTLPSLGCEGQMFTNGGRVAIGYTRTEALTVRLGASHTNKIQVPPQVVIVAGQTNAAFDIAVKDDNIVDGSRAVTVTAEAEGFASGAAVITVEDNDVPSHEMIIPGFDLTTNPGWSCEGQWQFGKPMGQGGTVFGNPDPQGGFTGTNVFGVNLAGDYATAVGGPYYLTVGPLDFTNFRDVLVQFRRWLNSDLEPYVRVAVEVSTNGTAWSTVWSNGQQGYYESAWNLVEYPLPVADRASRVFVRWSYQTGPEAFAASGWNLDDIVFMGIPVPVLKTSHGTPLAWLQLYGLTNLDWEVADTLDADGDGRAAWEEYLCDTVPTNRDSVLALLGVTFGVGGVDVQWKGGISATQYLERKDGLSPTGIPWSVVFTNAPPTTITNSVIDATGTNAVRFYRVRVVR